MPNDRGILRFARIAVRFRLRQGRIPLIEAGPGLRHVCLGKIAGALAFDRGFQFRLQEGDIVGTQLCDSAVTNHGHKCACRLQQDLLRSVLKLLLAGTHISLCLALGVQRLESIKDRL